MRKGNVLPIAVMAFAIVALLFMMDYSLGSQKWPWSLTSAPPTVVYHPVIVPGEGDTLDLQTYQASTTYGGYRFAYIASWRVNDFDPQYLGLIPKDADGNDVVKDTMHVEYYVDSGTKPAPTLTGAYNALVGGRAATQGSLSDDPSMTGLLVPVTGGTILIYWPTNSQFSAQFHNILASWSFAVSTEDWQTYTSTVYGFSVRHPKDWAVTRALDFGNGLDMTMQPSTSHPIALVNLSVSDRTQGTIVHYNTLTHWKQQYQSQPVTYGTTTIGSTTWTTAQFPESSSMNYLVEHGKYFYSLTTDASAQQVVQQIIQTFTWLNPDEKLVDLVNPYPITNVTDLHSEMACSDGSGFSSVSIMGERALIGCNRGKLFLYDGKNVTDISSRIDTKADGLDPQNIIVRGIGNDGSRWLISTARSGEPDHIYSYDGLTWTDLTTTFHAQTTAAGVGGSQALVWNGTYWLIGDNNGRIIRYDGTTFSDLTRQLPSLGTSTIVDDIGWNGSYWLIDLWTQDNHSRIVKYDGTTFTRLTEFSDDATVNALGWNGTYWLLGGSDNQHLLKYDGKTVTDTKITTDAFLKIAWVKSIWILSQALYDGTKVDNQQGPFLSMYHVGALDVGSTYGIIGDQQGNIYRFDFSD